MNNLINKTKYYLKKYGFFITIKKILKRVFHIKENRKSNQEQYKIWIQKNEPSKQELEEEKSFKFEYTPKISIVVPMYNTNEKFFEELVESLKNQTYSNWELCLADGSEKQNLKITQILENEDRIKYNFLDENKGISENTNNAIKMATGDYIGFLDHDDKLAPNALFEVVKVINEDKKTDFIYTDEDKIDDETKERFEPYFKPDFSPETLECNNYITHFVVIKTELQQKIGLLDSKFNGAQDFDFVLRATENSNKIVHISKILYHWRAHQNSTAYVADTKQYAYEAGRNAVLEHIKRMGKNGIVEDSVEVPGIYKIKYEIKGNPKVSIIIPNKDSIKILKVAIESILNFSSYNNYEIVIIENNSKEKETFEYYKKIIQDNRVKIINYNTNMWLDKTGEYEVKYKYVDKDLNKDLVENSTSVNKNEFNYSALINFAVRNVQSDFILQLNNDTKIITKDFLEIMIGYAQKEDIGAVGARLYFEDKSIQHAGIILGIAGIAGNSLVNLPYGKHAYFGREAATRNVSAVTGACLFSRKELYEEVGYMDENEFKVAFNDVDFCLKILDKGYRNVYLPQVELMHYESKTRGYEYSKVQEERFNHECENLKNKWKKYIDYDPYYNINFSRKTCNYDINTD